MMARLKSFGSTPRLSCGACKLATNEVPDVIQPSETARNLISASSSMLKSAQLSLRQIVSRTLRVCFYHFRQLRAVRQQLGGDVAAKIVAALVLVRLDYCNAILASLPWNTLGPIQITRLRI
jgi:hypothetical protein